MPGEAVPLTAYCSVKGSAGAGVRFSTTLTVRPDEASVAVYEADAKEAVTDAGTRLTMSIAPALSVGVPTPPDRPSEVTAPMPMSTVSSSGWTASGAAVRVRVATRLPLPKPISALPLSRFEQVTPMPLQPRL